MRKLFTTVFFTLLFCFVLVNPTEAEAQSVPLYETFERSVTNSKSYSNPFDYSVITLSAVVRSPSNQTYNVLGFYDGGNTWKFRFAPNQTGNWTYTYSWSDGTSGGSGSFNVTSRSNSRLHGYVRKVDNDLVYQDGTDHYFIGGKWFDARNYGPSSKGGQSNNSSDAHARPVSDSTYTSYLNTMQNYGHNGILLKVSLFPLEDDKITWDLNWLRRGENWVRLAQQRGIYVQIGMFDTWARARGQFFNWTTSGGGQVLNAWSSSDGNAKQNYIKTIVARFGGYSNVYWEVGNEMEHSNSGSGFVSQANSNYIPWIKAADPWDLPIGLSEGIWKNANVDIGFLHQTNELPGGGSKPEIMNELVRGGDSNVGSLWEDSTIRNSNSRYSFRRAFWQVFTYGGWGASEATWLNINNSLNSAVTNVMSDHEVLKEFIDGLPVKVSQMSVRTNWITSGPSSSTYSRTRYVDGQAYVTYFRSSGSKSSGNVTISSLPSGSYQARWISPTSGNVVQSHNISGGSNISISHPSYTDDIVLYVVRSGATAPPTPTPTNPPTTPPTSAPTNTPTPQLPGNLISNFNVSNSKAYTWFQLTNNAPMYIDRDFSYQSVPSQLNNAWTLRTANDDKNTNANNNFITFTANTGLDVYVMYTNVNTQLASSWLNSSNGWNDAGFSVQSTIGGDESTRNVRVKHFPSGSQVVLRGNGSTAPTSSMYTVAIKQSSGTSTPAPVQGDADGDGKVDGKDYTIWLANFGRTASGGRTIGDFDTDGDVDGRDYTIWLTNYNG